MAAGAFLGWRAWKRTTGRLELEAAASLASRWSRTATVEPAGLIVRLPPDPAWRCHALGTSCGVGDTRRVQWSLEPDPRPQSVEQIVAEARLHEAGMDRDFWMPYELAGFVGYLTRSWSTHAPVARVDFHGWRVSPAAREPPPPFMEPLEGRVRLDITTESFGEAPENEVLAVLLSTRPAPAGIPSTRPVVADRELLGLVDMWFDIFENCKEPSACQGDATSVLWPPQSPPIADKAHRRDLLHARLDGRHPSFGDLLARDIDAATHAGGLAGFQAALSLASTLVEWDPGANPWRDLGHALRGESEAGLRTPDAARWISLEGSVASGRAKTDGADAIGEFATWLLAAPCDVLLRRPDAALGTLLPGHTDPRVQTLLSHWFDESSPMPDDADWTPLASLVAREAFTRRVMHEQLGVRLRDHRRWGELVRSGHGFAVKTVRTAAAGPAPDESRLPPEGTSRPLRVCDAFAWSLRVYDGLPPFDILAPEATRDAQIGALLRAVIANPAPQ